MTLNFFPHLQVSRKSDFQGACFIYPLFSTRSVISFTSSHRECPSELAGSGRASPTISESMPTSPVSTNTDEDDYYTILNLDRPRNPNAYNVSKEEIKAAYHRTLLLYHPDKIKVSMLKATVSQKQNDDSARRSVYSIDQIMQAYQTLVDPVRRATYNELLLKYPSRITLKSSQTGGHLGVETFDLEDLQYNEEKQIWYKACRCGHNEGYLLTEAELEKESSEGEVYVGCKGCSLFIKVLFGVEEDTV